MPLSFLRTHFAWRYERDILALSSHALIAGVDEVGRGCLAGPVVACAVWIDWECMHPEQIFFLQETLKDSKILSARKREKLAETLQNCAAIGIGYAEPFDVEAYNLHHASLLAMHRALIDMPCVPSHVLIDGKHAPVLLPTQTGFSIVGGDSKSLSIAAASVIAKVVRDNLLQDLENRFGGYGFARHKGYATKMHIENLHHQGACPVHRWNTKLVCARSRKETTCQIDESD